MTTKKLVFLLIFITFTFLLALSFQLLYLKKESSTEIVKMGSTELRLEKLITPTTKFPLKNPIDLAVSKSGRIYVTDSDQDRIQVFNQNGEFLFTFGKHGAEKGEFNYPVSIVIGKNKNVYVAELYNQRISVFSIEGKFLKHIKAIRYDGANVTPTALAIDQHDFLYVIDKTDNSIKKLNHEGEILLSIGKQGNGEGEFQYPLGVDVSKDGKIIVSDTGNNRIQFFGPNGEFIKAIPIPSGPPSGVGVDENLRIFYTEPTNGHVTMLDNNSNKPMVLIDETSLGNDGVFFPEGIELSRDLMYLTDKGSNRILILKRVFHKK